MSNTTYEVEVIFAAGDRQSEERFELLSRAIATELRELGLHRTLNVATIEFTPSGEEAPALGVYLASGAALAEPCLSERVAAALAAGRVVIPVVDDPRAFSTSVPEPLVPINAWAWSGEDPEVRLARFVLEQLGIEESKRKVFISYKREDGLMAAEQLRDLLSKARFEPFIDRFNIRPGEDVQATIGDELEKHAFMLLLETPLAHSSDWVYDEVDYALSHAMGITIVRWPGNPPEVPGSVGLPRVQLADEDLHPDEHGYEVLLDGAIERVLAEVEAAHARGLVRRRRNLIRNIEEAASAAGCLSTPLPNWQLQVSCPAGEHSTLCGITPRLPSANDLQLLDQARERLGDTATAVLVHAARQLRPELRGHLEWVAGDRRLVLTPENAIGSRWMP